MTYVDPGAVPTVMAPCSPPIAAASGSSEHTTAPPPARSRKVENAPRSASKVP